MNPGNQTQTPIGSIQTDDPRTDLIETHGPCQQALCKGSVVWVGRRKQKQQRQARPTTDEGVHAEASQKGQGMVSGSVTIGGIRVATSPSQNGSTVNDQITGSDQPSAQSLQHDQHKQRLMHRGTGSMATFAVLGWTHNERPSLCIQRQATGQG